MKATKKIFSMSAVVAILFAANLAADDFGFDDSSDSSETTPTVSVGGKVTVNGRAYLDDPYDTDPDIQDSPTECTPDATLNIDFSAAATDISAKFNFSKDSIKTYNEDVIEEFTARAYIGNFIFEAGKEKLVWGKGDKLHVLDNFNANDYTDYIIPDYIDRRLAEPMFHLVYNTNSGARFEAVYTPMMTPDRLSTDGVWVPAASTTLTKLVTQVATNQLTAALAAGGTTASSALIGLSSFSTDDLYPDTKTLKYGQAGLRTTFTIGAVDLGASYYYGHNKQPSANLSNYLTSYITNSGTSSSYPELSYDQLQVFGLEAAFVAGPFNTRWEAAYNLTKDVDGDDPWTHNNSIAWVGGFDVDLPIHNINVNIQETGKLILHGSDIKDGAYAAADVDADANDCFTNNKLVVNISDTFNHEKIKPEVSALYGIERGDLILMPKLTITVKQNFDFIVNGMYIWCKDDDSEFRAWENNSFAQIGVKYQF